jgi:lipopolysaccharide export LptBFGC system permease protein LptF
MWQFQWMINLIPDAVLSFIYWAIIFAGITGIIAGWIGKWIPFYGRYAQVLKPVGIVLLVLGVWLRGGYDVEMAWRDKVRTLEEQVKVAEEKANTKNIEVETKVVEKTKVIKEKGKDIIKYVDREVIKKEEIVKYIEQCPVPKEIIDLHNQATDLNKAAEGKK